MEDLAWKPVIQSVNQAKKQFVPDMWPAAGPQILEKLCAHYGIDVTDRRQLNCLMQCLGLFAKALASTTLERPGRESFGLDQTASLVLSFSLVQTWAGLTLELSEHLPPEVRSGRRKRERIYAPQPNPAEFNWSAIAPDPSQIERYEQWRRSNAARETLGLMARRDQAQALFRDLFTGSCLFAYIGVVACAFLTIIATLDLDPSEVPPESAERFRDVVLVTMYNHLPAHLQALGRAS